MLAYDFGINDRLDRTEIDENQYFFMNIITDKPVLNTLIDHLGKIGQDGVLAVFVDTLPKIGSESSYIVVELFPNLADHFPHDRPHVVDPVNEVRRTVHNLGDLTFYRHDLPVNNGIHEIIFTVKILIHRLLADTEIRRQFIHRDL